MLDVKQKNIELLSKYEPKGVMVHFAKLSNIPHGSGNEKEIGKYIADLLKEVSEQVILYPDGTVYASKKATQGFENKPMVCLQAHSDMVCVKRKDSNHNFLKDPLELIVENGILRANGTSLGADNCIGVAYILDIFTNPNIEHGPIECLITTAEETTMGGVKIFQPGVLKSKYLINLDSEYTDLIYLGCCGGIESCITNTFTREPSKDLTEHISISIKDGCSGHSGSMIRFKIINTIKLMFSLLKTVSNKHQLALVDINGGQYKNAIAGNCFATIAIKPEDFESVKKILIDNFNEIKKEFSQREKKININVEKNQKKLEPINLKESYALVDAYNTVINGVITLSEKYDIADGSNNVGIIETEDNCIKAKFLLRSLYHNQKHRILNRTLSAFYGTNFSYKIVDDYPEWTPVDGENILEKKFKEIYRTKFNKDPQVCVTEGGLEAGVLVKKYPEIIAVSIGPDIRDAHTFGEYAILKSVKATYEILVEMLKTI